MLARQAVLLTPSKSSGTIQLLFYKQNASVSPLFATLTSSSYSSHSIAFSRPLFSYSYELLRHPKIHNFFLFFRFQTPCQKHPGWYTLSSRSSLVTRHFPSSEAHKKLESLAMLCPKRKPVLPFQQLAHSSATFCTFLHRFRFSAPLFSTACEQFCIYGGGGVGLPHLTVGKLRGKMETHKPPRTHQQGRNR